jgi:hypothetical protein
VLELVFAERPFQGKSIFKEYGLRACVSAVDECLDPVVVSFPEQGIAPGYLVQSLFNGTYRRAGEEPESIIADHSPRVTSFLPRAKAATVVLTAGAVKSGDTSISGLPNRKVPPEKTVIPGTGIFVGSEGTVTARTKITITAAFIE